MNLFTQIRFLQLLLCAALLLSRGVIAFEMPPKNTFLADSNYALGHGDPAQQDAMPQAGPSGPTRTLKDSEIDYVHTGPGYFGINTSGVYANGKRVLWGNGLDRIVKLDYESQEVLAEYYFPGVERWSEKQAEDAILVDTSLLAIDEVVLTLERYVREKKQ